MDESDAQSSKSDDSSEDESESTNEEEDLVDSDVEFDAEAAVRPSTPIPFWLRTDEDVPGTNKLALYAISEIYAILICRHA